MDAAEGRGLDGLKSALPEDLNAVSLTFREVYGDIYRSAGLSCASRSKNFSPGRVEPLRVQILVCSETV